MSASLRYIVDSHWLRQWKKYVGITVYGITVSPGPMSNESLLNGKGVILVL